MILWSPRGQAIVAHALCRSSDLSHPDTLSEPVAGQDKEIVHGGLNIKQKLFSWWGLWGLASCRCWS